VSIKVLHGVVLALIAIFCAASTAIYLLFGILS
jgi:hypothetical protein